MSEFGGDYSHLDHLSVDELLSRSVGTGSDESENNTSLLRAALARVTNVQEMDYFTSCAVKHILSVVNGHIRDGWQKLGLEGVPAHDELVGTLLVKMLSRSLLLAVGPDATMNLNIEEMTDKYSDEYAVNRVGLMREMYQEAVKLGATVIGGYIIGAPVTDSGLDEESDMKNVVTTLAEAAKRGELLVHRWGMDEHGDEFDTKNRLRLVTRELMVEGATIPEGELSSYGPPFMDYNPWRESLDGTRVSA